eukprot:scaffold33547_cov129-Isochrysis_galbana.AAC.1
MSLDALALARRCRCSKNCLARRWSRESRAASRWPRRTNAAPCAERLLRNASAASSSPVISASADTDTSAMVSTFHSEMRRTRRREGKQTREVQVRNGLWM